MASGGNLLSLAVVLFRLVLASQSSEQAVVQVTASFSFGGGSTCSVKCTNVRGKPCAAAYGTRGGNGMGAYVRLGSPAAGACARVDVLLIKVAQEYHLTQEQTVTATALPVLATDVLAVPPGGFVNSTPPWDFLCDFPERFQQICAGYIPLAFGDTQYVANASACTGLVYDASAGAGAPGRFQLNSTDASAVFSPPDWGREPERIPCSNITIEIGSMSSSARPLRAAG